MAIVYRRCYCIKKSNVGAEYMSETNFVTTTGFIEPAVSI